MPPDPLVARLRAAGCVFAEDEARLLRAAAGSPAELDALAARRVDGAPLEALLGWAEFCGLRIAVDPGVFVPRQRTAFLVAQAVRAGRRRAPWSWTCAAAPARSGPPSPPPRPASRCTPPTSTRPPSPAPGATCPRVYQGDLYAALPERLRGRVDLLVVNAPYVPTDAIATMPPEARDHEPRVALDGGADGLDVQRRVAADAPAWLRPGGALLIETGADQAPHTAAVFAAAGLVPHVEYAEDATVVIGVA